MKVIPILKYILQEALPMRIIIIQNRLYKFTLYFLFIGFLRIHLLIPQKNKSWEFVAIAVSAIKISETSGGNNINPTVMKSFIKDSR